MTPKLYCADLSPAVRASLLAIKAIGVDVELVPVNLMEQEHLKPEFLEMNPFHTVPTLQDGNFFIWDSGAINIYLAEKYGKDDSLYPTNAEARAVINQRLFFNSGILFPTMGAMVLPLLSGSEKSVSKDNADSQTKGYSSLETLLEKSTYVAGEKLSLADLSIIATVSSANVLVPISSNKYPKITEWIKRMQALPYYEEANQAGLNNFIRLIKSKLA